MRLVKDFLLGSALIFSCFFAASTVSADRLDEMISPMIDPVNFEDPRSITEARLIYLFHELGNDFVTEGGDIQLVALQLRYALNERLALIATKDGYVFTNPDEVLENEDGFANIGLGAKYAFYRDAQSGTVMSGGLRYEIPSGNTDVLQGEGDGIIQPSLSAAIALNERTTSMFGADFRLPIDDEDSTIFDASAHIDYKIDMDCGSLYPLVEFNVMHVIEAGERLGIPDEGQDFFNLGATGSEGKTLVTAGVGARYRLSDPLDFGLAYQFPLTSGAGSEIIDWRITADAIYRF